MKREEVISLFKTISEFYPYFKETIDTDKVNAWYSVMRNMDCEGVKRRLMEHVQKEKFAPTIADISYFKAKENETLKKMNEWEKEAQKVPESKKKEFQKAMEELIRGFSNE